MRCLLLAVALCVAVVAAERLDEECGPCRLQECPRPSGCVAGRVKDRCNCCDECGKGDFERCHHEEVASDGVYHGTCGDNMECNLREDVGTEEPPQAICYCTLEGTLCGSNNVTFPNMCQLLAASVLQGSKISIAKTGPCDEKPSIVSRPDNTKDNSGASAALVCEARGYPIPTVEWTWTKVDGETIYLPSDDLRVSVNMRGGPEKWQVTGWLQILDLQEEHEGDYTCVAQNTHGMANATARIIVESKQDRRKERQQQRRKHKNDL